MTSVLSTDACRVTVVGPGKRVDLAVPMSTTVAALLPVLLWHVGVDAVGQPDDDPGWVLQRLGGPAFEPTGTPESLEWLEGDELYLRPAADPLPELAFDDLADGIATMVNRRGDRWQPEYRRPLFITLSVVGLLVLGTVLAVPGPLLIAAIAGFAISAVLIVGSVLLARADDRPLSLLFGVAAAGFAGCAALNLADGAPTRLVPDSTGLMVGGASAAAVVAVLVVAHLLWGTGRPQPLLLVVLAAAVGVIVYRWLGSAWEMSATSAAAVAAVALFGLLVFSPKVVLRAARLRGPQLPKTGEELKFDNQPLPARDVDVRAGDADNYLSVVAVTVSVLVSLLFHVIMTAHGWPGWTLVSVLSSALLLRARSFFGLWQRASLAVAGSLGVIMVVLRLADTAHPGRRVVLVCAIVVLVAVLVQAARRPWPRRLLPIWEYTATVCDVLTAVAMLPLALLMVGSFSWARGLFG